jgi:hypothetical protein
MVLPQRRNVWLRKRCWSEPMWLWALPMLAGLTQTDSDGRFRLENIPPGRYYIVLDPLDVPSYYPGVTKPDRATIVTVSDAFGDRRNGFQNTGLRRRKSLRPACAAARPLTGAVMVNMTTNPNRSGLSAATVFQGTLNLLSNAGTNLNIAGVVFIRDVFADSFRPVSADGTFEFPKSKNGLIHPFDESRHRPGYTLRGYWRCGICGMWNLLQVPATAIARGVMVRGHVVGILSPSCWTILVLY